MTDFHTHILPEIDDGSKSVQMSIEMLRMERDQGVDSVALTSHFYRDIETPESYLRKRAKAFEKLTNSINSLDEKLPRLFLGAEVAWVPGLVHWDEAEALCYEDTRYMLIEPPFQHWTDAFIREMVELQSKRNITPVIAHIDRYYNAQIKDRINALLINDFPVQISASALLDFWGRGTAFKYIREGKAQLIISDCHNVTSRKPNIGDAMEVVIRKFGEDAWRLFEETDDIIFG